MPVGDNLGRQLNVFVFEVVRVRSDGSGGRLHEVVAVHPLVTAPTSVRYTDPSRSALEKTIGGSVFTRGGRNHQRVTLSGVWGVEARGFGGFQGTGPQRAAKFRREVVRLPEALTRADVDAELAADLTSGGQSVNFDAPALTSRLADYDPAREHLAINWIDFYNGVTFEAKIDSYEATAEYNRGASVGNRAYVVQITEIGPAVATAGVDSALAGLFGGLQSWFDLNQQIRSFTGTALAQSVASVSGGAIGVVTDLAASLQAQLDGVEDIASGRRPESTFGTRWFAQVAQLEAAAEDLAWTQALQSEAFGSDESGEVRWLRNDAIPALDRGDAIHELETLREFCALQAIAGGFLGMTASEWRSYLSGGGGAGQRDARTTGSTRHTVSVSDTADTLAALYGVAWDDVLALNGLTPDEALRPGCVLHVPRRRGSAVAPSGLPVIGSHVGPSAWGADLAVELDDDGAGDLRLATGEEVLEQGVTVLFEEFADLLQRDLDDVPSSVRVAYVQRRIAALLVQDPRYVAVPQVTVTETENGIGIEVAVQAVNGGTVRAGG